jgi:hypothetical protein
MLVTSAPNGLLREEYVSRLHECDGEGEGRPATSTYKPAKGHIPQDAGGLADAEEERDEEGLRDPAVLEQPGADAEGCQEEEAGRVEHVVVGKRQGDVLDFEQNCHLVLDEVEL